MRLRRRKWASPAVVSVVLCGAALAPSFAFGSVASASSAPTASQISQCTKAATGHGKLTNADMSDCAGFPSIAERCPSGPGVKVISVNSNNIAIRQGQKPIQLSKSYTVTQLKAVCGKAKNKPTKLAAPSTPKSSSALTPTVPSTFGGNAQPALATGKSGSLDVTFVGAAYSLGSGDGTIVPVEVLNATSQSVGGVDISGPAMSGSSVVGSGDSQDVEPAVLAPGEVAFGMVFYTQDLPPGSTFNLTASANQTTNYADAKVVQANYSATGGLAGPAVVGTVSNPGAGAISSPIPTDLYCFDATGTLQSVSEDFVAGDAGLAPGATGSYSIDVEGPSPCTTFLVGSSGSTL
jgi:hypothetical protein